MCHHHHEAICQIAPNDAQASRDIVVVLAIVFDSGKREDAEIRSADSNSSAKHKEKPTPGASIKADTSGQNHRRQALEPKAFNVTENKVSYQLIILIVSSTVLP